MLAPGLRAALTGVQLEAQVRNPKNAPAGERALRDTLNDMQARCGRAQLAHGAHVAALVGSTSCRRHAQTWRRRAAR